MGGVVTTVAATSDVAGAGGSASVTLYVSTSGSGSVCSETSPCGTIQAAIDTATAGTYVGEYVTIDVATGTYSETDTVDSSSLAGLTITGAGAGSTEIDGDDAGSVLTVSNGTVNISDLTITGGNASDHGGGIANAGTVNLFDTTLTENNGSNYGGAIWNSGFLTVIDSDLNNNTASYGGAIYNSAFVTISTSTLSDNSAGQGGGGLYSISDATVSDSTVSGNTTSANGGGLFEANNSLSVTGSTLSGNTATDYGGGIESDEATITVDNSTVSGNTVSTDDGGGIDIEDLENSGSSTIENSTVVRNSAPSYYGGGIQDEQSPLTIGATIVAGSTSGHDCFIQAAMVTDLGYNLDDDGTCHFTGTGDLSDNSSAHLDPSGLADNNGPTETVALEAASSAIGAVTDPSLCPATDQRGAPRTTPCAIGAYDTNVSGPFSAVVALGSQTFGGSATVTSVAVSRCRRQPRRSAELLHRRRRGVHLAHTDGGIPHGRRLELLGGDLVTGSPDLLPRSPKRLRGLPGHHLHQSLHQRRQPVLRQRIGHYLHGHRDHGKR